MPEQISQTYNNSKSINVVTSLLTLFKIWLTSREIRDYSLHIPNIVSDGTRFVLSCPFIVIDTPNSIIVNKK